jgi:hypothetical protein
MKKYASKIRSSHIVIGTVILVFVLGAGLTKRTLSSGRASQNVMDQTTAKPLRIDNKTSALEIADVERLKPSRVRLTLKNTSDKGITAFALSESDSSSIEIDLFPDLLLPGQTRIETFTLPPVKGEENVVEILCVIFDDQTSEGKISVVNRIQEDRLGGRLAATSMHPHLKQILDASDGDLLTALREARLAVLSLSRPQEVQPLSHTEGGFNSAKELVLINLDDLLSESQHRCDIECLRRRLSYIEQREYRKMIIPRR